MTKINLLFLFFIFSIVNFSILENPLYSGQSKQDLSSLRQWVNKDPFEYVNGKRLFDNKIFQDSFNKTVGPALYKAFMTGYKGKKYFQSERINEEKGTMIIYVQDLSLNFKTTIFLDYINGHMDVCWNGGSEVLPDGKEVNAMIFHDGRQIAVPPMSCDTMTYNKAEKTLSFTSYTNNKTDSNKFSPKSSAQPSASLAQQETQPHDKLIGNWIGEFIMENSNKKKYKAVYNYTIYTDPTDRSKVKFKQVDTLVFINPTDVFSCNMKNAYSNSFQGDIAIESETVKFIQRKIDNPACGGLSVDIYRFKGDALEAVYVDDGKATSGYLKRN